jgi:small GTP-binding protein
MSLDRKKIIKNFSNRFLNLEEEPENIADILNMPPSVLKECTEEAVQKLAKNKIHKIGDLSKIDSSKIETLAKKFDIEELQLRKWVLAAQLISRSWIKRKNYLKKTESKIAVLGLNNAGKTSILENLSGKVKIGEIVDLEPTIGVDVRKIESENFDLVIWDFGGQTEHRYDYLQSPEEYFLQIDLLIFVVDMQDTERFDESIDYFKQILDIILYLNEKPYFLILLHKSDPDIVQESEFQINFQYLHTLFSELLTGKVPNFEVIESSLYNFYATEPEFAKTFKGFFGKNKPKQSLEDQMNFISETLMNFSKEVFTQLKNIQHMFEIRYRIDPNTSTEKDSTDIGNNQKSLSQISSEIHEDFQTLKLNPPPSPQNTNGDLIQAKHSLTENRASLMSELKSVLKFKQLID